MRLNHVKIHFSIAEAITSDKFCGKIVSVKLSSRIIYSSKIGRFQ